jgi:hypothetical protein
VAFDVGITGRDKSRERSEVGNVAGSNSDVTG